MKLLNKLKISLLITFFIIILFNLKCLAVTGVVTEITVNMRKEPSTDSKRIMYVTQDYKVEVLEKVGEWYKIKYNGVTGYVFAKYVDVDESKLETKKEETSTEEQKETDVKKEENTDSNIQDVTIDAKIELQIKNETKVRLIPNITSNVIYISKQVISINVIEQIGNWSYIYVDKIYGWVRTEDIIEENADSNDTTQNEEEKENEKVEITERKVAYVKYDNVNLRKKASTSSSVLAKLKLNNEVIILEEVSSKWTKVEYDGTVGYVSADLLSTEKQGENEDTNQEEKSEEKVEITEKKVAYIKYDTVNLRKKASTSSTILSKLKLNNEVIVLEEVSSKWTKVEYDGIVGYVSSDLLANEKQEENKIEEDTSSRDGDTTSREEETSDNKDETKVEESVKEETTPEKETTTNTDVKEEDKKTETNSRTKGEEIAEYAKQYVGYKYVLGGASPKNGFDCSGLTYYVYKQFGYTISRSSRTQAKDGKEVSKDELQPGDLLIFKNQSLTAIGHVGIYIGNNKMVHASEPGVGVVITDLDAKGYNYNKRYVTARRIV